MKVVRCYGTETGAGAQANQAVTWVDMIIGAAHFIFLWKGAVKCKLIYTSQIGGGANNSSLRKTPAFYNMLHRDSDLNRFVFQRPKQQKMDIRFGTWNVRSLYKAASVRTVARSYKEFCFLGLQLIPLKVNASHPSSASMNKPSKTSVWSKTANTCQVKVKVTLRLQVSQSDSLS
jgi:hypothetical protein